VAQVNDLSRSLTAFDPISTLVVVVEMSKASWLVSGAVPGVERQPLKKLEPDATALLRLIDRWRNEAVRAGRPISRIALAYEAGRDGFWLARWLIARGIEAHVIHSASVAVSRERKRAKTDRLDAAMLMRVFLGWLRGERGHCGMVAIPTMEEEDARRPSRERESLVNERSRITNRMKSALARLGVRGFKPHLRKAPERLADLRTAEGTGLPANIIEEFRRDMARLALVREQISSIEKTRAERLERAPDTGPHAMVRLLARVIGIGIETADMLVREILSRADPVGVALPDVPERQCAGALVSHADRGAERRAQDDDDRGTGAQATDRTVAPGHDRRGAGRCRATAGGVSNTLERERTNRVRHLTALDAPGSR
jgi:transposase